MMLLATMLNYMDRQTLAVTITDINRELHLSKSHYGNIELAFGLAFAIGGLLTGLVADVISVRWLYPAVLAGWSLAGFATAYAEQIGQLLMPIGASESLPPGYLGLLICRTALGFFEAGQWPCALVTSQRLLSANDRPLGNGVLQSGAAAGAILTPLIVEAMVSDAPGTWRGPFQAIGVLGMLWILPWLALVRPNDLRRQEPIAPAPSAGHGADQAGSESRPRDGAAFWRRFAVLVVTVITINACFHFFRAWLPTFLREFHDYKRDEVNYFTSAYFAAAGIGCLCVGMLTKYLTRSGWSVQRARMATFIACACLTALSTVAAELPRGPLLLALLLVIGFGALGLFPNYYSLTQELSARRQGVVTGVLGFSTWVCTGVMQKYVGQQVDQTHSYAQGIFFAGLLPLVACAALVLFWDRPATKSSR